jgi:hypothetical protein
MDAAARIQQLERKVLLLEASTLFQTYAHATLYSIAKEIAQASNLKPGDIDQVYQDTLKGHTEAYLAGLADTHPDYAAAIRSILKAQLGPPIWPGESDQQA